MCPCSVPSRGLGSRALGERLPAARPTRSRPSGRAPDAALPIDTGARVPYFDPDMTACFQSLGEDHLDPFVHAPFMLSCGLIVGRTRRPLLLLKT